MAAASRRASSHSPSRYSFHSGQPALLDMPAPTKGMTKPLWHERFSSSNLTRLRGNWLVLRMRAFSSGSNRRRALNRFRGRRVEFLNTRIDDNPGRNDWVVGTIDVVRDRDLTGQSLPIFLVGRVCGSPPLILVGGVGG